MFQAIFIHVDFKYKAGNLKKYMKKVSINVL